MAVHYGFLAVGCVPASEPFEEFMSYVERKSFFNMTFENWSATLYTAQKFLDDGIHII